MTRVRRRRIGRVELAIMIMLAVVLVLTGWAVLHRTSKASGAGPPLLEDTSGASLPPGLLPFGPVSPPPSALQLPAGHVPILMYHYIRVNPVASDRTGFVLLVTPTNFAAQMQWAHDHDFHTITLAELLDALLKHRSIDAHAMVITFDDGYSDFFTAALPVLRRYDFHATAYIVPGFVGRRGYLTWEEVLAADAQGTVIGSHSMTHPNLTRQSPAGLVGQVFGSKRALEGKLGHPVVDFCYPSGRFNSTVSDQVARAGYHDATTTVFGAYESLGTAMSWPRVRISGGDSISLFARKLLSGVSEYQRYGDAPPGALPSPAIGRRNITEL